MTYAKQRADLLNENLKIPSLNEEHIQVKKWVKAIQPDEIEDAFFNTVLIGTDGEPMAVVSSIDLEFTEELG